MAFQIDTTGITFAPNTFAVDATGVMFAGTAGFQVQSSGITFTGSTFSITPSNPLPESGEQVVLNFAGDPAVAVTWRVISIGGGYTAPTITAPSNLIGSLRVPAVKADTALVIGGLQGTGTELRVTLTIQAATHGFYTSPGVWVPMSIEVYQ